MAARVRLLPRAGSEVRASLVDAAHEASPEELPPWAQAIVKRQDAIEERLSRFDRRTEAIATQVETSIERLDARLERLALKAESGPSSSEMARLDTQIANLARETKAAEGAIAQALKLLQAQVMSKASRSELQHVLSTSMDAVDQAHEKTRALAADVETRAPREAIGRLETFLKQQAHSAGSPIIVTQRVAPGSHRISPLLPTHCLSCKQALPYQTPPPMPHETAGMPIAPTASTSCGPNARGELDSSLAPSHGHVAVGHFCASDAHMMRAKLAYGKEPQNDTRRRTQQMLSQLSGAAAAAPAAHVLGQPSSVLARPTSAPTLHGGRKAMRSSASAARTLVSNAGSGQRGR